MKTTPKAKRPENEPANVTLIPVWLRLSDAIQYSGISRSTLYELFDFAGGPIRTSCLRQRGRTRGIRLVNRESLLAHIESCCESQQEGGAA